MPLIPLLFSAYKVPGYFTHTIQQGAFKLDTWDLILDTFYNVIFGR